jgi:hypothetical protein
MTVRKKELPNGRKKVPLDEKKKGDAERKYPWMRRKKGMQREREAGMCFHCLSPPKSRRSFKVTYIDKECCHQV